MTDEVRQALLKGGVGCVPFVGPLLAELVGLADDSSEEIKSTLGRLEIALLELHDMQLALRKIQADSSDEMKKSIEKLGQMLGGSTDFDIIHLSLHALAKEALSQYAVQSAGNLGAGAVLIQIQGNNNSVSLSNSYKFIFETPEQKFAEYDAVSADSDLKLLVPYSRSTTFVGRDELLDEFVEWAVSSKPFAIRQMTGNAGAGKTRFAIELLEVLNANRKDVDGCWIGGFIQKNELQRGDMPPDGYSGWSRPALLVLDYAAYVDDDTLKQFLIALYKSTEKTCLPVRVLLLNRSAEGDHYGWMNSLRKFQGMDAPDLGKVLESPFTLKAIDTIELRVKIFQETYNNLAERHSKSALEEINEELRNQLDADTWNEPLNIMMAAAVAVRSSEGIPYVLSLSRQDLAEQLADREEHRLLMGLDKGTDASAMDYRKLLAASAILSRGMGQHAVEGINQFLQKISGVNQADARREMEKVKDLLPILPGRDKELPGLVIGFVQPDIISEALIYKLLEPFSNQDVRMLLQMLIREDSAVMQMLGLCIQDFAREWDEIEKVFETKWADKLLLWLENLIEDVQDADLDVLLRIADQMPSHCLTIRDHSVRIYQLILDRLVKTDLDDKERLQELLGITWNSLGNRLSETGRREEALAAAEEAVKIRRELANQRPEAFLPALATSLNNLGNRLSETGRRDDALAATEEAVKIRRELAKQSPGAFLFDLAMSLLNLGNLLGAIGQREEALAATEEATGIYRELANHSPEAFLPALAASLNNLGNRLRELGRREEALSAAEDATGIYRELANHSPEAFLPALALSLNNLGVCLSELGHRDEALAATEEAVKIRRELVKQRPKAFLPDLAFSLNNLGCDLCDAGRRDEALAATEEAVKIRRELAKQSPEAFLPDLVLSLNNLGDRLSDTGRRDDALAATEEAEKIRCELAKQSPEAFLPALVLSLNNLGNHLSDTDTLTATEDLTAIYRELAKQYPGKFLPDLAMSLGALHKCYLAGEQHKKAVAALEEAIGIMNPFISKHQVGFANLLQSLVQDYLDVTKKLNEEPDEELLKPFITLMADLDQK